MGAASYYGLLLIVTLAYFVVSKRIFDEVNDSARIVVDELFHLPQGEAYSNGNFSYWDPKITTFPGLYLVSATFIGTLFPCSVYNLRFVNLVASCVNLMLFSSILKYVYYSNNSKVLLQAINLAILPPVYFFSHVYYTDTLSLTFLLAFSRLCFTNKNRFLILILGGLSVLMRQTNVVWVAMVFGHKFLDVFIRSSRVFGNQYVSNMSLSKTSLLAHDLDTSKIKRYYGLSDVYYACKYHLKTFFRTFFKYLTLHDLVTLLTHSVLLISFIIFVYKNGSIVLGDKQAHEATLHLPQLLYFLLFYGVFGLPYVISKLRSTLKLIFRNKMKVLCLALIFGAIVHFNTIVHPYLLADNRHFTFYIWQRWFGKYDFAIYATIPVYVFLIFSLFDNLVGQNCISFLLPYSVSLFLALALQKMIEIRYFLIPYIIIRLRFSKPSFLIVLSEFLWFLMLNAAAFHVFFTKAVFWEDFDYVQRIIW